MNQKIEIGVIKHILEQNIEEHRTVASIMEDLRRQLEADAAEKPPAERLKKQYVILLSDPEGHLEGKIFTGWVLQVPEDENPATAQARLIDAALAFNTSPKGRRVPITSIGEACEALTPKATKDHQLWIKTKEPVYILRTNNRLPSGI